MRLTFDSWFKRRILHVPNWIEIKFIVSRGDWLWNSANFKGLNNISDVERVRHVTLTVEFIQDGGQCIWGETFEADVFEDSNVRSY